MCGCKGICSRFKATKPSGIGRYASGQKRCMVCTEFIQYEGLWCPCCGYRLRTKPRNREYKAKLRERIEAEMLQVKTPDKKSKEDSNKKQLMGFTPEGKPILKEVD